MIVVNLLDNIALLVALSVIHGLILRRWRKSEVPGKILSGVLFGAVAIFGMTTPVFLLPGIIFDGRSIVLSIAGLFGGPIVGAIAAGMAMVYRVFLGGDGALTGVMVIACSAGTGTAYHLLRPRWPRLAAPWYLLAFGVFVHLLMLLLMLTLPGDQSGDVLRRITAPVLLLCPLATLLIGLLFLDQESRLAADQALRESEERFKAIAANTPDHILVQDRDLRYLYVVNPQLGLTERDMIGKTDHDFLSQEDADTLTRIKRQVLETGQRIHVEVPLVSSTGEREYFDGSYIPRYDAKGRIDGLIGYFRNVTSRKQAEQAMERINREWRTTFDAVNDVIWLVDHNQRIVRANRATEQVLGRQVAEVVGRQCWDVAHDPARPHPDCPIRRMQQSRRRESMELPIGQRWYLVTADPIIDADGNLVGAVHVMSDMTERKRVEMTLRENEAKYRGLFENIQEMVAVYEVERDGRRKIVERRLREANAAFLRAAGVSAIDQVRGKTSSEIFGKNWADAHSAAVQEVMDTGHPRVQEVHRPESDRHYITTIVPLDTNTYLGTAREITAIKEAEEALRASEERFRTLAAATFEGIAITEAGRFIDANEQFLRMLGYDRGELLGMEVAALISADDRERVVGNILAGRESLVEHVMIRRDGGRIIVEAHGRTIDSQGRRIRVTALRDLTERREAEMKYSRILATALSGFWLTSADGRLLEVNDAACRMLGYSREELLALSVADIEAVEDPGQIAKHIEVLWRIGHDRFETRHCRKDGTIMDVEISVTHLDVGGGQAVAFIGDVTDRKRAEAELARHRDHLEELVEERTRELEKSREQLRRAERLASLGTLAAGIAHEINNPLGMLLLGTELALRSLDQPRELEETLLQQKRDIERCSRIVKGVLGFARQRPTEKLALDLRDVLRSSMDFTREYAKQHGVALEAVLAEQLHLIKGNTTELEQLVANLVYNAVQACHKGGHVTVEVGDAEGKVRLVVRDDGCGMEPEEIEHAFDPFYTTRLEKGGTGLGLSTVHGIVADHGGTIDVTSAKGQGTAFRIEFPWSNAPENSSG